MHYRANLMVYGHSTAGPNQFEDATISHFKKKDGYPTKRRKRNSTTEELSTKYFRYDCWCFEDVCMVSNRNTQGYWIQLKSKTNWWWLMRLLWKVRSIGSKLINRKFMKLSWTKNFRNIEQISRNNNGMPNGDLNGQETNCWLLVQLPKQESKSPWKKGCQSSKSFMMAMVFIFGICKSCKSYIWKTRCGRGCQLAVLDGDVLMLWSQFHHNQGFLDIRFRHFGGP